jgi:hypothetical protein
MAGKAVNSSFVLLSKFVASRQESASKTATSNIRKPYHIQLKLTKSTVLTHSRLQNGFVLY